MSYRSNKFDWADAVIVSSKASPCYHPGEVASVCGITKIESEYLAKKYQVQLGGWIYTIEFKDGIDIDIPEKFLDSYL